MYGMFPRRDGPINLIIVTNPPTCAGLCVAMCEADVCPRVCQHACTCLTDNTIPADKGLHVPTGRRTWTIPEIYGVI